MKRKTLICLLTIIGAVCLLFGFSSCKGNEEYEIYVDGYTLQIEEDGTYSILNISNDILKQTELVIPLEIGGYTISHLASRERVPGFMMSGEVLRGLGSVRKLTLPTSIVSVGDVMSSNIKVVILEKPVSEIDFEGGLYYSETWFYAPQEDDNPKIQYLTAENFVDNMVIVPKGNSETPAEATLLFGFGEGELTIPDTYNVLPITEIGKDAFQGEKFTKITLGKNIRYIEEYAFDRLPITDIELPEGLWEIGPSAFTSTNLTQITIPSTVEKVYPFAFNHCTYLQSFDFSKAENLSAIEQDTFAWCDLTGELKFPPNLKILRKGCMQGAKFSTITIPDTLETIGEIVFANCENLTEIVLPDNVLICDASVMYNCPKLEKIHFGMVRAYHWGYISKEIRSLKEITVSDNNEYLKVENNILYSKDGSVLYLCPMDFQVEKLSISCSEISKYAFAYHKHLKEIVIEEDCTKIDQKAFFKCESLEKVVLPSTLNTIEWGSFQGCSNLKTINTEGIKVFNNYAFAQCGSLQNVSFANARVVGQFAFFECDIQSVALNEACEKVEHCAFGQNKNLKTFTYNKEYTLVDQYALSGTPLYEDDTKNENVPRGCNKLPIILWPFVIGE